jgi:hypothetical protein
MNEIFEKLNFLIHILTIPNIYYYVKSLIVYANSSEENEKLLTLALRYIFIK